MKPLPWRILVLTDALADSGRPVRVAPGGADGWLASLGAVVETPAPGGGTVRHAIRGPVDLGPAAVAAHLAAHAGGAAPSPAAVDAVLHNPAFQRVESAWRGLALLLEHAGDAVEVEVLSLPRKLLAARFREEIFAKEVDSAAPLSLVLADFDFTHKADDLAALSELAGMMKVLQAPIVAGASPGFFDLRYLVQVVGLPDLIGRMGDTPHAGWRSFQSTEPARWVALTINRFLARAPFAGGDGGHVETASESNPDSYVWGRGVWLVGAAVARSVRTYGHALDLSGGTGGRFERLATRAYPVKANETAALATEVPLSEMAALELSRAAFTPVVGAVRSDVAILPLVVTTFRLRPGRLTVEGTLAYQLTAARLAQFCGLLMASAPAGAPEEVAAHFRKEIAASLGSLAGDAPDEAVTVEVVEERDEAGAPLPMGLVKVKPKATLEGKPLDFTFLMPLGKG